MTATDAPVLALVRHGETDWNRARRIQGRTEVPLNDTGREQARGAAATLATREWASVHASPLGRAIETAEIIAAGLSLSSPAIDHGLWERDFGEAEGLSVPDIEARWPGLNGIPGAEPLEAVAERSARAIAALYEAAPSGIVVAHGAMLRAGIRRLTGDDVPRILNGEIWLLRRGATGYAATRMSAPAASPLLQR